MFQRLKGAFDSIAEEQARQRAGARNTTNGSSRNGSLPSPGRLPRFGSETESRPGHSVGPDPDPNAFEPDNIMSDDSTSNLTQKYGPHQRNSTVESLPDQTVGSYTRNVSTNKTAAEDANENASTLCELTTDVESKLRRLHKLESKYQELLRAYKRAHARNAIIEPFESQLRESTPLTSISDPDALSEFMNQLNKKTQMIVEELKRVAEENEGNKKKLKEAEGKTEQALDELLRLRQRDEELKKSHQSQRSEIEEIQTADRIIGAVKSQPSEISKTEGIVENQDPEANENMFSIDDELPRLQEEVLQQAMVITDFRQENALLRKKVLLAEESTERMRHDLEKTKSEIHSYPDQLQIQQSQLAEMGAKVIELNSQVTDYQADLQSKECLILKQDKLLDELQRRDPASLAEIRDKTLVHNETVPPLRNERSKVCVAMSAGPKDKREAPHQHLSSQNLDALIGGEIDETLVHLHAGSKHEVIDYSSLFRARDETIRQLRAKLKDQTDLSEEIEILRDEVVNFGQEHVEAKEQIRLLRDENQKLLGDLSRRNNASPLSLIHDDSVDNDLAQHHQDVKASEQIVQASQNSSEPSRNLTRQLTELNSKYNSMETELRAAEQLATSRYNEVSHTRQLLQQARSELASTRMEMEEVKLSRDELRNCGEDLKRLEAEGEGLKSELSSLKQDLSAKDVEIRKSHQRLEQEILQRATYEEAARRRLKESQKTVAEKQEISNAKDSAVRDLSRSNKELEQLRSKIQNLEQHVKQLSHDTDVLRDELSVKTAQHASAESLMGNVRDQATEMAIQMKETKDRCESLEEELTDAHRLMSERGRESETMRRLLTEAETRSDSRLKEMRERMERTLQERDNAEAEIAITGRRRARENEELRTRTRNLERDLKSTEDARKHLEAVQESLRDQNERDARKIERQDQELNEVRRALGELRDLFDKNESQTHTLELEKSESERSNEEARQRLERLQKSHKALTDELRALRFLRIKTIDSGQQSSQISAESLQIQKIAQPTRSSRDKYSNPGEQEYPNNVDFVYLKNVLLQFLEQRDRSHQLQLIPVLSMLLHFDKKEEQKWMAIVNTR